MRNPVAAYAALGDSFTCGTGSGGAWPDVAARSLGCRYANLAAVGATSADVEERQLEAALALRPDLVSVICGANDVLASVRPDAGGYAARLGRMLDRLRRELPGATIVTATYPDLARFVDLRRRTRERVRRGTRGFNDECRRVARERGLLLLDWAERPETRNPGYVAGDGFHPSSEGHRRAAREFLAAVERHLEEGRRTREQIAPA